MANKLKIAILVKSFSRNGGMERYVVETCRRLVVRGHSVDIYACEAERELLVGMRFHQIPVRFSFSSVLRAIFFARESAKMLEGNSYDIVHSHEKGYCRDVFTAHCFSYKQGMEKYSLLRRIDQKYLSLRSALYLWLEKRQMATPWLVAVSEVIVDDIKNYYERFENVVVIPPGVDSENFHPDIIAGRRKGVREAEHFREDELVVLFVGSEFRRKGLDLLLRAIRPGMQLLVVGRGDDLAYHKQLVKKMRIAGQVSFAGLTNDVLRYYAAADVVVLPSRSEAFGMSIIEGMACGLPVIVSKNSGVASLINHGENGFVLHESSHLPGLLQQLFDKKERRRLGLKARGLAENYSWDRVAEAHEALYRRIITQRSF